MNQDFYRNLFWQTGLPEAWLLSRPMGDDLFLSEMANRDIALPKEARQLRQKQEDQSATEGTQSGPVAES